MQRVADAPPEAVETYLRRCPKVELHVHLEGAIRPERLLGILRRHGLHRALCDVRDVAPLFRHRDFAEFLEHFRFVVTCVRDVQDVHDVALDLFRDLQAENVVDAEVIFSASIFTRLGMPLGELLAAVTAAADTAAAEPGRSTPRRFDLVLDLVRNFGAAAGRAHVEAVARAAHPRVRGIHLGGDEAGFPAGDFAAAFAAAREAGLGRAAHAGEADGAASVRAALDDLGVQRIGHGIRALEEPALVAELVRRGTTLEVCPSSNVATGLVPSFAAHPLPELLRRGVRVALGADDPSYFDTTLTGEMRRAHHELGLDLGTLDACTDAALDAAFLPETERAVRRAALWAERRELRRALGLDVT